MGSPSPILRRFIAVIGAPACLVLAAACSSTSNSAGGGATVSVPTTQTSSAAGGASVGTGVGASATSSPAAGERGATPAPGTITCTSAHLQAGLGRTGVAAGSSYVSLTFKNVGDTPCTLFGFPGVSFGNGTPAVQVGQPAERDTSVAPAVVTLAPGGSAYSQLRVTDVLNFPASTCSPADATTLLVYPPNNTTQLSIPFATKVCSSSLVFAGVQAVQPGTGG